MYKSVGLAKQGFGKVIFRRNSRIGEDVWLLSRKIHYKNLNEIRHVGVVQVKNLM